MWSEKKTFLIGVKKKSWWVSSVWYVKKWIVRGYKMLNTVASI